MKFCRKDLPSTFRITKIRGHAKDLLKSLKEGYISKINKEEIKNVDTDTSDTTKMDNEESEQDLFLEPIPWYPDELAWNSNLSRRFIRRSVVLQKLHRFLVEDSECGAITRQEAVSMIPPLMLGIQPDHVVLDMCAAPGSKTAQIIEMMHAWDISNVPTGTVVANDADHKRCYMLTHQAKRLNTPCVIITNHDASIFPKLYDSKIPGTGTPILFDRVLCDVPCSGDGTIRKNPNLWNKWNPHLGVGLHRLQARILTRGLELLKVGGRLVYSTCSFNPIENEAVLANVLSQVEDSVHIVDCNDELPGLIRRPGMTTWKVFDRKNKEYKKLSELTAPPSEGYKKTMFPPTPDIAEKLKLKNAMRIFPHLQNTGGFFIAVLEKTDELPWQKAKRARNMKFLPWEESERCNERYSIVPNPLELDEKESEFDSNEIRIDKDSLSKDKEKANQSGANRQSPPSKKIRRGMIKEDPFLFLDNSDHDLQQIRKFYNLSDELPSQHFLVRSTGGKKNHIYLVSQSVHKIMTSNSNLKVINTGVRVVTRSSFRAGSTEHGMEYRLVQDGIHLLQKYIGKRVAQITLDDMILLISNSETNIDELCEHTRQSLKAKEMGCIVWQYRASDDQSLDRKLTTNVWFCGHIGRKTVQIMLSKEERKHFLRILGAPIPKELQEKAKEKKTDDDAQQIKEEEILINNN